MGGRLERSDTAWERIAKRYQRYVKRAGVTSLYIKVCLYELAVKEEGLDKA